MRIKVCYISNTGKVRRNNEDSLLLDGSIVSEASMLKPDCLQLSAERHACFVADGMGGHMKGEVASKKVLESLRSAYEGVENEKDLRKIMRRAKEELNDYVRGDRSSFGLGTTLSGILFAGEAVLVLNCGDSRVYRLNGRHLVKLTKDHSVVQRLHDEGVITEDEMRTHPHRNIITSALTGDLSEAPPEIFFRQFPAEKGQKFLICSDGLWESMPVSTMEECFEGKDQQEAAQCLFTEAMERGGSDNISLIILDVLE